MKQNKLTLVYTFWIVVLSISGVNAQEIIFGEIIEKRTGEALIGASIRTQGSDVGTITEWDGSFQL
jgi:hypothetical protein